MVYKVLSLCVSHAVCRERGSKECRFVVICAYNGRGNSATDGEVQFSGTVSFSLLHVSSKQHMSNRGGGGSVIHVQFHTVSVYRPSHYVPH